MTIKRVAVLLGGRSAEREVSLTSGHGCAKALREEGFDAVEIDPRTSDLAAQLNAAKPDVVFNALHGRWGEDGCVQGLLELLGIPYTHSGVLASALAMDKQRAKDVFRAAGLPLVKSIVADRRAAAAGHLMEPPYVVKPVNEGSSVGVFIIRKGDNRPPAALGSDQWTLSEEMMVEEFVPGRELTVAVMGDARARRHRNHHQSRILRLRSEIRGRRFGPHAAGEDSRRRRRRGDAVGRTRARGARLPRRLAHRFPLRRHRPASIAWSCSRSTPSPA